MEFERHPGAVADSPDIPEVAKKVLELAKRLAVEVKLMNVKDRK
jgi:hypothetical protein